MYRIAALYKFVTLDDPVSVQAKLRAAGEKHDICGTLLVANEGLNGTIAGYPEQLSEMIDFIRSDDRFASLDVKYSDAEEKPFLRFKVRLKKEIVTLGQPGVSPDKIVGTYVEPTDWNEVIEDPDTVVIDTRNDYEIAVGTFKNAINPKTESFRDFPEWVEKNREALEGKRVAMFCTGGIRCEKASSYMLEQGFDEVLHLKGGILKYLETQKKSNSLWKGDCFVFDNRVAVGHGLEETDWTQCFACRSPLTQDDLASPDYEKGVSCPKCIGKVQDRTRYKERQKQMDIAKQRGDIHLGRSQ